MDELFSQTKAVYTNSDIVNNDFGYDSLFFITNASVYLDETAAQSFPLGFSGSTEIPTVASSWSLTEARVPDTTATVALLALGLASLAARRRRFDLSGRTRPL